MRGAHDQLLTEAYGEQHIPRPDPPQRNVNENDFDDPQPGTSGQQRATQSSAQKRTRRALRFVSIFRNDDLTFIILMCGCRIRITKTTRKTLALLKFRLMKSWLANLTMRNAIATETKVAALAVERLSKERSSMIN